LWNKKINEPQGAVMNPLGREICLWHSSLQGKHAVDAIACSCW